MVSFYAVYILKGNTGMKWAKSGFWKQVTDEIFFANNKSAHKVSLKMHEVKLLKLVIFLPSITCIFFCKLLLIFLLQDQLLPC